MFHEFRYFSTLAQVIYYKDALEWALKTYMQPANISDWFIRVPTCHVNQNYLKLLKKFDYYGYPLGILCPVIIWRLFLGPWWLTRKRAAYLRAITGSNKANISNTLTGRWTPYVCFEAYRIKHGSVYPPPITVWGECERIALGAGEVNWYRTGMYCILTYIGPYILYTYVYTYV